MKIRKMWMDEAPWQESTNSYLKYYKFFDDDDGSPTSDAHKAVYVLTKEEMEELLLDCHKSGGMHCIDGSQYVEEVLGE